MPQSTGWERARRRARRKGVRRALYMLAFLPVALALLAGQIWSAWWNPIDMGPVFDNPVNVWLDRIVGSLVVFFLLIALIVGMARDLPAFRGDPVVVRGEITGKTEWAEDIPGPAWILRLMLGYGLMVNVKRAVRIARDGSVNQDLELLDAEEIATTRRVHRRVAQGQEAFLICTSTGRAIALLSDLHEDETAKELIAVLGAASAS